jgi:hypothetical protein
MADASDPTFSALQVTGLTNGLLAELGSLSTGLVGELKSISLPILGGGIAGALQQGQQALTKVQTLQTALTSALQSLENGAAVAESALVAEINGAQTGREMNRCTAAWGFSISINV